jgi:hypothetical protein
MHPRGLFTSSRIPRDRPVDSGNGSEHVWYVIDKKRFAEEQRLSTDNIFLET